MSSYSEIIQVMAAMIIFSMILLNANRMIHRNTLMQIEGELEQEVIAIGQEIIEEARTKSFDEVTVDAQLPPADIPGNFAVHTTLGPDATETSRRLFDDFDDYEGWEEIATTPHGDFLVTVEVFYVDDTNYQQTSSKSIFKKIEVTVSSEFLRNNVDEIRSYKLEFMRNYYAD